MLKKRQFVKKLEEYDKVDDLFLVLSKQIGTGRNRQSFLRVTIGDSSGSIETRLWEGAEEYARMFRQGDVVYLTGKVTSYKGVKQISTDRISPVDDLSKIDWSDFFPVAPRPADEMWSELAALLSTVKNPEIRRLIGSFTDDAAFMDGFRRSPAAAGMHHAYISGLLEHTLGVVKLADAVSALYRLDRDLLIAGAFLHDIGKTRELKAAAGFDYTDEGRLIGHLIIGLTMVREKCGALPGFPADLQMHVEHLMLSHHGELEWGSPKRPKTVEALALHAIDNIDAKICAAFDAIAGAGENDEAWTGFIRMFERPLTRTPEFSAVPAAVERTPEPGPVSLCQKVETPEAPDEATIDSLVEVAEESSATGPELSENSEETREEAETGAQDASPEPEPFTPESQKPQRSGGQGSLGI